MIPKSAQRLSQRRSCSNKEIEHNDDSTKGHCALVERSCRHFGFRATGASNTWDAVRVSTKPDLLPPYLAGGQVFANME
jgi:hypothetical protein